MLHICIVLHKKIDCRFALLARSRDQPLLRLHWPGFSTTVLFNPLHVWYSLVREPARDRAPIHLKSSGLQ